MFLSLNCQNTTHRSTDTGTSTDTDPTPRQRHVKFHNCFCFSFDWFGAVNSDASSRT